jgi:hypothetical protein
MRLKEMVYICSGSEGVFERDICPKSWMSGGQNEEAEKDERGFHGGR